jgi:hypothetical protein
MKPVVPPKPKPKNPPSVVYKQVPGKKVKAEEKLTKSKPKTKPVMPRRGGR